MAYSSTNPPQMLSGRVGGTDGIATWGYKGTDSIAAQAAAGFVTNGLALGLQVADPYLATVLTTAGAYVGHSNGRVSAVSSTGATVVFVSSST